MSQWLEAAKRFEENSHSGDFFEAQSGAYATKRIKDILTTSFPQMIFLLGEPGSGKSFLLNHLRKTLQNERECILIENPFLTPIELLKRLLSYYGIQSDSTDVEALRLEVTELYRDTKHLIMLDEAQLMRPEVKEFIRILSDSKVFWFLIAMHKREGEEMLSSPHFHSRPHHVVYLGDLHPEECKGYLIKELQPLQVWDVREIFPKKLIEQSWRYSHGNFRNFKKCYYHLFLLLDISNNENKKKYLNPNQTLLKMAAIRSRLIPSKINTDDFDQLEHMAKQKSNKQVWKYLLVLPLFIVLFVGALWLSQKYDLANKLFASKQEKTLHVNKEKVTVSPVKKEEKVEQIKPEPVKEVEVVQPEVNVVEKEKNVTKVEEVKKEEKTTTSSTLKMDLPTKEKEDVTVAKLELLPVTDEVKVDNEVFLEEQEKLPKVQEEEKPLLQIKTADTKSKLELMINKFDKSGRYEDALEVAKKLYADKNFEDSADWAKRANRLDSEREEAWLLYARSQYNQGLKKEAISVLKLFLDYKYSKEAKNQLNEWKKEMPK